LELGFVGTLNDYQRRGLFRILYRYFDHLLLRDEYDISSIQGIPFFYRQFGYDFILPLGKNVSIVPSAIPTFKQESRPSFMDIVVRKSTEEDIVRLMELYSAATSRLMVFAERDKQLWLIQEQIGMRDEKPVETMVVEQAGHIQGYFRVGERRDTSKEKADSILVTEASILTYDSVLRILHYLKQMASDVHADAIEVPGDTTSNLANVVLAYGGVMQRGWKYQIRIPDVLRFLNTIRPVLQNRIKGTMYEGFTREIDFNLYRTCYRFKFVNGRLDTIEDIGMQGTDTNQAFRIPPSDFIRLVLGDCSVDELRSHNVDFTIRAGKKHLLETLFPKKPSFLYNYQV
jgi:predicted acetyltransferase